jgi:soluble lytic murein transglycosylase-like protein
MSQKTVINTHQAVLTPVSDTRPEPIKIDDSARLREIRKLVEANNRTNLPVEVIICHIYMESRFDKEAQAQGSSARGLMQLLRAPVRELYRLENLKKTRAERRPEADLYREADALHDSPDLVDEATNIRIGTSYLQALIDKRTADHSADPIAEAYKDYRGIRNGIYYAKIKSAADKLAAKPESMQVLRDMVK